MRARWFLTCLCTLLFLSVSLKAQQYAFAVTFTDKQGSTGSISNPSTFLSARSIARRTTQGIAIDSTDLPVSQPYIDSVLAITNGIFHTKSKWLNYCVVLLGDTSQVATLRTKSFVADARYIAYYSTFLHHKPAPAKHDKFSAELLSAKPSLIAKTTGTAAYYGAAYNQISLVHGDCLHDLGFKGEGKLIAILDAGFQGTDTHPGFDSLFHNNRIVDVFNVAYDTTYVYSNNSSHGTSCLSTIAGNLPGNYVGTAPNASFALYVTEDSPEQPIKMYNLVAGAERADSVGVDVISVSLGYDVFDSPWPVNYFVFNPDFDGKTTVPARGANMATKKGILFVSSAGNDANYSYFPHILTPGDADSALTVGAVQGNGGIYGDSGPGPNATGITKPDVCAMGVAAAVFLPTGGIANEDGTSFSTPQIAGLMTCLWQAAGNVSPHALRVAIDSTGDHRNNIGSQYGYGIPDFCQALQILDVKDTPQNPMGTDWIRVGPNPIVGNMIVLHLYLTTKQDVSFRLYDISGREVLDQQMTFPPGYNSPVYMPFSGYLPSGMYLLKARSDSQQVVVKMMKL